MTNEIQNINPKPRSDAVGEVLVRGADGKMYILRDGRLVPRSISSEATVARPQTVAANSVVAPRQSSSASPAPVVSMSREGELAVAGGFSLSDATASQRMKDIADAYAHGVRDELETKSALLRPLKLGGMGMKSEAAEKVLAVLRRLPKETLKASPQKQSRAVQRAVIARVQPGSPVVAQAPAGAQSGARGSVASELDRLVGVAVKKIGLRLGDPVLTRRFETTVSARLRDVRDALETRDILVREVKAGGMGFSPVEAERVGGILDGLVGEFTAVWQARESEQTEAWKKRQAQRFDRATNYGGEENDLNQRHENLLKRAGVTPVVRKSATVSVSKPPMPVPRVPEKAVSRVLGSSSVVKPVVFTKSAVFVSKPALPPPPPHAEMPLPAVIAPKGTSRPAMPMPQYTVPPLGERYVVAPIVKPVGAMMERSAAHPIPSAGSYSRPKVQDVRFSPRLLSPVDELKELKLADFRRLGRDAGEIVFKLRAKVDLLAEESFAKKMDGIKALKQSEPWRLYFLISGRALESGMPVEEVIGEWEKKKESTLTNEEFRAIMEMNKGLRF